MSRRGRQAWAWTISALATLPAAAQAPVFSTEVKLVRLAVTVRDEAGALVGGLPQDAFRIFDSGVPQQVAVFEKSTLRPLSVAILLDASGSTARVLPESVAAVRAFCQALWREGNPEDVAALYAFNHEVTQMVPFTRRRERLEDGLKRIRPEAGTSLYDAMQFASLDLMAREGRRVIVLVTDGSDTTSATTLPEATRTAQRAEVSVFPILLVPIQSQAGYNVGGENALTIIATRTGGQVQLASRGAELSRAFTRILEDLRTQYLLGYYPRSLPPSPGGFREVRVEIVAPAERKLRAVTRSGYYEEARGPSRPWRP